jgi:hypothetical protein
VSFRKRRETPYDSLFNILSSAAIASTVALKKNSVSSH